MAARPLPGPPSSLLGIPPPWLRGAFGMTGGVHSCWKEGWVIRGLFSKGAVLFLMSGFEVKIVCMEI